jgi:Zn-dependent protease with chaperone function
MRVAAFQAVLAHEYGHFSNRDTAGGGLALSVRRSVVVLATHLARGGAAHWYNPAWLFVNGFHRVFLRISQGASRLQEVLADRWAALLFGAHAFEEGLRHVIDRSVRFDVHADAAIREVVEAKRPLANLYQHTLSGAVDEATVERKIRESVEREASPYDSHPCPLDRFRWVHALGTPAPRVENGAEPAWSLFRHRDAIEERMTNVIRSAVRANHGISIAAS